MKLKFDGNQDYQLDAIAAVVDLFTGQMNTESRLEVAPVDGSLFSNAAFANTLTLGDAALLENLQTVQERNELTPSEALEGLNFTVEMETGTGQDLRLPADAARAVRALRLQEVHHRSAVGGDP